MFGSLPWTIFTILMIVIYSASKYNVLALNLNEMYAEIALDYFQTRNVSNVILLLCWKAIDRVKLLQKFSESGIRAAQSYGVKENPQSVKEMYRTSGFRMGVVFDVSCYSDRTPSFQPNIYFNESYVWLVLDYGKFDFMIKYISTLPLSIVTDGIVTKTTIQEDKVERIEMYDVYNSGFDRGASLNVTYIGQWKTDDQETKRIWSNFLSIPKANRRQNLNKINIKAVTFAEHKPENKDLEEYLMDEHNPHLDSVFKMNYRLIRILKFMYNFTIVLVMADNWTDKNVQGIYRSSNLIGVLAEKKADVMAGALQLMNDRISLIDDLHMTYPFRSGFIFRFSGDFGNIQFNFLKPFDGNVWIIMLSVSSVILVTLWCILIFENKFFAQEGIMRFNISDAVLSILTAWCQMGSGVRPSTFASRLVYATLFFTSLILYNYYTSSIVSTLLSYRFNTFSLIDLADSPMKCGSLDIGYVHNLLFDIPTYPNMKYFNEKKKHDPFYFTVQDGVRLVKMGGFAYHSEFSTLYTDISNTFEPTEICELQEVDTIPLVWLSIMAQKHSPYSEMFRVGLMKIRERGQLKRLLDVWVAKKPICQSSKGVSQVNIHQTVTIFLVLAIGHSIAVGILLCERYKWKKASLLKQ